MSDSQASTVKRPRSEARELIALVRQRACLWDRACAGYRNRELRDEAWHEVCQALHPEYADLSSEDRHELGLVIMRKWYNIRDAYRKAYSLKGNTSTASRPYVYADYLTFLIPIFENKGRSNDVKCEAVGVDEEDNDHEPIEWLNVFELDQAEGTPPKRSKPNEYKQPKEKTVADDSIMSVLVNLIEKEDDEDRAFFRSITPSVKSLPDDVKFIFRIRVMELLDSLKKSNKHKKDTKTASDESDTE